jgi:signal peptidase II
VWLDTGRLAWRWYLLALTLVLLDQWTKSLASLYLDYGHPLMLLPVLDLTLLHNTGAAFSFMSDAGGWQRWAFSLLSAVVSVLLIFWLPKQPRVLARLSLSLILAGALGNLVDRVTQGYVVDFISLHYESWYFPAFNLADSCISVGAALLLLEWLTEPGIKSDD